jgi:pyruvate/oxaloacetate carboxyltransferase/allophanate hydrolase subunit 1/biotin carboxyl carrier protein
LVPTFNDTWEVDVLLGPQEAPDYLTQEDVETLFNSTYEVSHNANRLGVRLIGPKPKWARTDGGEGGSHPSNINDNPYAIGSINFTGDNPVVLTADGPSLGGFVCPITIPSYDLWKIGQARPGNKIKFRRVTMDYVVKARATQDESIRNLGTQKPVPRPTFAVKPSEDKKDRALIHEVNPTDPNRLKARYRIAGDRYLMVEYGEPVMDINSRVRVHLLEQFLLKHKPAGLIDTIPGVRTLLIWYDNRKLSLEDLMKLLNQAEEELPDKDVKLKSRVFELPLAFHDKWNREATQRYMNTIRSEALYLPDNVDFVAKNNGLAGVHEVEKIVMDASYLVLGLGDVYLGAPCAVPLDPRHRLVVPKYNPARTYTPEGAVGIGGMYMCIYPMESPGGYQLIGRTLPIWNTRGDLPNFSADKPWLLDMFDQVRYKRVSEDELEALRTDFQNGKFTLKVKEEELCMKEYNQFLKSIEKETTEVREKQKIARDTLNKIELDSLKESQAVLEDALKVTNYLANMAVNGPDHPGAVGPPPSKSLPTIVSSPEYPVGHVNSSLPPPRGLKNIFDEEGPAAFAKAVLNTKGALLTDTTWRDAHQSLLMTRMRTLDMVNVAKATSHALSSCYSIEMWGGATFDVALRFLHECPWERLATLRELVPNVPFQMLFRGANAVGYSSYPDNVVYKFCKQAKDTGIDVFRIFDSLNYLENMRLGIDAVGEAGGIIEATICYTGDLCNPNETKYPLEYYLNQARELVKLGIHVLCIKDMAGLMKPAAATRLISAIRKEFPNLPIHVHAHDTAGTAVASALACFEAGANAVDCCNDALAGLTAQGSMGAILYNYNYSEKNTGVDLDNYLALTSYWEGVRRMYAPYESGQKSAGADVYKNQIPGGQYTNLYFQALSMGLAHDWEKIKHAYADANQILGDIVKVTPSSKVVGDLASFMVSNKLDRETTERRAKELNFPSSVIEFLQGYLGQPHGGFPEPFRSDVLKELPRFEGRPGADMAPFDFVKCQKDLEDTWKQPLTELDVMSHIQFPDVFKDYMKHKQSYGPVTNLPTPQFLAPMSIGEKVTFKVQSKAFTATLDGVSEINEEGFSTVTYDIDGEKHRLKVKAKQPKQPPFILRDAGAAAKVDTTEKKTKADPNNLGSVGAPLPGKVLEIKAKVGDEVKQGEAVVVLSSMKLQLTVTAPRSGKILSIAMAEGDAVSVGDLLFEISK